MAEADAPCEPVYYSRNRGGTKMEFNGFVNNKDIFSNFSRILVTFSTSFDEF